VETVTSADDFVSKLSEIGWLEHLSARKRARLPRDLREWSERDAAWTYLGLASGSYDIETIEDDSDYADLIRIYGRASNGVFDPRDVESRRDREKETALIAFTLSGHRFQGHFSLETGDYVAEAFEPFINSCLAQVGLEGRFFTLPMIDQVAHVVFVPPTVYAAAERAGLFGAPPPTPAPADRQPAKRSARESVWSRLLARWRPTARRIRAIERYCSQQGIEVPKTFGRHPTVRFGAVRTDCSPPALSAAPLFDEHDLHRYIQNKMRELGVSDGSELPLRVLDFEHSQELQIGPTGETHAGEPLVPPFKGAWGGPTRS
jgi:hypothetical protein